MTETGSDSILQYLHTQFLTVLEVVLTQLYKVFLYPLNTSQRIYWLYLLTSLLGALLVYLWSTRSQRRSATHFLRFLFPKKVWQHPSAWLDVRYFFFHQLVRLIIYTTFLTGTIDISFTLLTGSSVVSILTGQEGNTYSTTVSVLYMIGLIAFLDFIAFFIHMLQHRIPFLWEFHKVHHSAEVMHPLTNYREHPVDNVVYSLTNGVAGGLFMGLSYKLLGYLPSMPVLLGVPVLMFMFNLLGYNLRHSHIWLRWPGKWAMIFGSPAHHQIHHSCHPDHIDKNFAFMFPLWDVLFKTYEVPQTNKDVHFGISKTKPNIYTTCMALYLLPFKFAFAPVVKHLKRSQNTISTDTQHPLNKD
ncbi:sterol desaturase family protein [Aliamphritea spongicola]|uniref:sterol desaturase family protein n=1 Tax=Aliamphritea spongicola TaxID=707589 RepID=UPI00196B5B9D|nr:sterol desaturase family protein [Aliamphritea spongicola]MBN3560838.1 sterol desaturase family protein [Aliamphritea spongicola]